MALGFHVFCSHVFGLICPDSHWIWLLGFYGHELYGLPLFTIVCQGHWGFGLLVLDFHGLRTYVLNLLAMDSGSDLFALGVLGVQTHAIDFIGTGSPWH